MDAGKVRWIKMKSEVEFITLSCIRRKPFNKWPSEIIISWFQWL